MGTYIWARFKWGMVTRWLHIYELGTSEGWVKWARFKWRMGTEIRWVQVRDGKAHELGSSEGRNTYMSQDQLRNGNIHKLCWSEGWNTYELGPSKQHYLSFTKIVQLYFVQLNKNNRKFLQLRLWLILLTFLTYFFTMKKLGGDILTPFFIWATRDRKWSQLL